MFQNLDNNLISSTNWHLFIFFFFALKLDHCYPIRYSQDDSFPVDLNRCSGQTIDYSYFFRIC